MFIYSLLLRGQFINWPCSKR